MAKSRVEFVHLLLIVIFDMLENCNMFEFSLHLLHLHIKDLEKVVVTLL